MRYAARVLGGSGSTAAAHDVVQETWLGAIRGLRKLRDPARFAPWIYGIVTRKCVDEVRTRRRRERTDSMAVRERNAAAVIGTADEQLDLADAVRRLPPIHRAVVHLFYREELTLEEIAAALKIPVGTAKSRLHHAREALKAGVQKNDPPARP